MAPPSPGLRRAGTGGSRSSKGSYLPIFFNHGSHGWHGSDPLSRFITQRHGGTEIEPQADLTTNAHYWARIYEPGILADLRVGFQPALVPLGPIISI